MSPGTPLGAGAALMRGEGTGFPHPQRCPEAAAELAAEQTAARGAQQRLVSLGRQICGEFVVI